MGTGSNNKLLRTNIVNQNIRNEGIEREIPNKSVCSNSEISQSVDLLCDISDEVGSDFIYKYLILIYFSQDNGNGYHL